MRRFLQLTAAALAAVVVFGLATLPPAPIRASAAPDSGLADRLVPGAYHVHTTRSDGGAPRAEVAAAAARAGLRFVIFTDHGDGTAAPEPPAYIDGVLCLDGVEISTNGGHYVALDMPAAPYPLGGEAEAVAEDVRRLGGFGIAAHPESAKPELAWNNWSVSVDGIEWLNADSEWRDEPVSRLARFPFDYLFRTGPALASMLDRPSSTLARWDGLAERRAVVGLAGHDAHGGVAARVEDGQRAGRLGLPSYEASFRAFALRAVLKAPLGGDAAEDGRALLEAIRSGRVLTAIDAIAGPAWLDFRASQGGREVGMGEILTAAERASFFVRAPQASGARVVLVCNGVEVAESAAGTLQKELRGPGSCRVEVRVAGAPGTPPTPWIVSNPIYLQATDGPVEPGVGGSSPPPEAVLALAPGNWVIEKEPGSEGRLESESGGTSVSYRLRAGDRVSQYVALAVPLRPPLPAFDRVILTGRADGPMRLSVQLRFDDRAGARWGRSVYLAGEPARISVPIDRLVPADGRTPLPDPRGATGLLFVVDLTNAPPGSAGRFHVMDLALARAAR